jgi:1-aminocyclopropane-1-carboxylate deaminase/D-cysteine desulfhydrase-like pyridoxal-dependent ACC family enzyme
MRNNMEASLLSEIIKREIDEKAAILQEVIIPDTNKNIKVYLKREDLIHSTISGNKWRKLKYNLFEARKLGIKTLLTFGGAFSNHIYATASAGKIFGFNTIGIIRGEEHLPLNPTLSFAQKCGMQIHYIDRSNYRKKKEVDFIQNLRQKFGEFYLIPEGGTNILAVKGSTEIIESIDIDFDYIISACGTGGTLSGLICGLNGGKNIIGLPVLKGADFLNNEISRYVKEYSSGTFSNWKLDLDYHLGGYAKISKELVLFIKMFEEINQVKLDPIYTGKLLYGIQSMIQENKIPGNPTIIAIHTGGLQGIDGMKNKMDKLLS